MLKIRWSHDRLIFNIGIPIPVKTIFILRWGPGYLGPCCNENMRICCIIMYTCVWNMITQAWVCNSFPETDTYIPLAHTGTYMLQRIDESICAKIRYLEHGQVIIYHRTMCSVITYPYLYTSLGHPCMHHPKRMTASIKTVMQCNLKNFFV